MKQTSIKIGITCFVGASIGTLIGLQFASVWGLFISIVTGLLLGYLLYEAKAFIKAIPVAFSYAQNKIPNAYAEIKKTSQHLRVALYLAWIPVSIFMPIAIINKFLVNPTITRIIVASLLLFFGLCMQIFLFLGMTYEKRISSPKWYSTVIKYWNPVLFPFTLIYQILRLLLFVVKHVVKFGPAFCKKMFVLIHSEARLICAIDSGIGAAIGWYCNHTLIGGIIGAIFGILNYWVVSIKILKLQQKI